MTAYAAAFKSEVERMVRKTMKTDVGHLRKQVASQRSEIAALKRELKAVTAQCSQLSKSVQGDRANARQVEGQEVVESASARRGGRKFVFHAAALVKKREALGITQKDMAVLLGVSLSTERKWETEIASPRATQIDGIRAVLAMGKRAAIAHLSQ